MRRCILIAFVVCGLLPGVALCAAGATVDPVLSPYQVIQCDENGAANIYVSGSSTAAQGTVQVRIVPPGPSVVPWGVIGTVKDGR
jgi:hypothetical protein